MKASALKNIPISNCPLTNTARVIDQLLFAWDDEYLQLIQKFRVFYVDVEGVRIISDRLKPYDREVPASNFWLVDALGDIVMEKPEYDDAIAAYTLLMEQYAIDLAHYVETGEGVEPVQPVNPVADLVGEYDFFLAYAENPIQLYPLLYSKALGADAKKRFD